MSKTKKEQKSNFFRRDLKQRSEGKRFIANGGEGIYTPRRLARKVAKNRILASGVSRSAKSKYDKDWSIMNNWREYLDPIARRKSVKN